MGEHSNGRAAGFHVYFRHWSAAVGRAVSPGVAIEYSHATGDHVHAQEDVARVSLRE
jgi:hypothetical protein